MEIDILYNLEYNYKKKINMFHTHAPFPQMLLTHLLLSMLLFSSVKLDTPNTKVYSNSSVRHKGGTSFLKVLATQA